MSHYHVVDCGDRFILFSGTLDECLQVQYSSYAGLVVLSDDELESGGLNLPPQIHTGGSGTEEV